jgi:glycosyltransferase involved in cell wall biosynthesis
MMRFLDYDIVMMALPRWDGPYSSTAYSLAKELSRHTRVFYIDNPVSIKEYFKKRNLPEINRRKNALFSGTDIFTTPDAAYPNLFAVTPRVTLPINWLPKGFIYDTLSRVNDAALGSALNHVLRIFGIKRYILINSFNPLFGKYLSLRIKPMLNVYQSVDDIRSAPYMEKHGPRLENEAIAKADFTIVTSSELQRLKSAYSQNVFLLPNAANTTLFRKAIKEDLPMPYELQKISPDKKIICYTGNICQRLDYELLKKVAIAHSDKILLMIGPLARKDYETSGLSKLPNVIFTGKKKIEELPAYLKYSHCCIIPFLCNQNTKSIYPLKINEYLSAGKPVVTTNFSEDIMGFKQIAGISENHNEFIKLVGKAIDEDTETNKIERMVFSASNNWEARAHHFIDLTVEFLKRYDRGAGKPERKQRTQAIYG